MIGGNDWALVLAGGDGERLAAVAEDDGHGPVPKQYCHYLGAETLLDLTIERARRLADPHRVATVVTAHHERWWPEHAQRRPDGLWVVQSEGRGTAAGVLLPVIEILRRDADAVITILPSDHDALEPEALEEATRAAAAEARRHGDDIILVGITPNESTSDYGYIVPAGDDDRTSQEVARFVEKPSPSDVRALLEQGAMWSSLILSARGAALIDLFATHLPELLLATIAEPRPTVSNGNVVTCKSAHLADRDFSRDVLQHATDRLRVVRAPRCGWSDLGTPDRLRQRIRDRAMPRRGGSRVRAGRGTAPTHELGRGNAWSRDTLSRGG